MTDDYLLGIRVTVQSGDRYANKFKGHSGVVERVFRTDSRDCVVGVRLDGLGNPASSASLFWFSPSDLKFAKQDSPAAGPEKSSEEDYIMLGTYKRAEVQFLDSKENQRCYSYALYDTSISVGDVVVVHTGHHGLSLARINAISDTNLDAIACGREVVSKVDFAAYEARRARAARLAQLKREMDTKVQQIQQEAIYAMMAEKDPALKTMLDEWQALMGAASAE